VKVEFRQPVKLFAVSVRGADPESAPTAVKLFSNKPHIGFQEAEDEQPTEALNFAPRDVEEGTQKPVRFVKFQNVSSLQFFVEANMEDEEVTKIKQISFFGQPAQAMDMKDWNPKKG